MAGVRQWLREGSGLVGADLSTLEVLRDGEAHGARNDVRRVAGGEGTWVLKSYLDPTGNPVAREAAGLLVAGADLAPRLVGVATDPPVLVMEDLGDGHDLADLLRAGGPDAAAPATDALVGWADTLARLHRRSAGRRGEFVEALERHGGCGVGPGDGVEPPEAHEQLVEAVRDLERLTVEHDLPTSEVLAEQVRGLVEPLAPAEDSVLSPGDTCPDNNRLLPGVGGGGQAGVVLLDFEFAGYRHPAWDLAYLTVPWPTCWCCWALPEDVVVRARTAYEDALGPGGWTRDERAEDLLGRAVLTWCLASVSWFLTGALEADSAVSGPGRQPAPARRALALHRLALAAGAVDHPGPAGYAASLREALVERWGEQELPPAPAYVGRTPGSV